MQTNSFFLEQWDWSLKISRQVCKLPGDLSYQKKKDNSFFPFILGLSVILVLVVYVFVC